MGGTSSDCPSLISRPEIVPAPPSRFDFRKLKEGRVGRGIRLLEKVFAKSSYILDCPEVRKSPSRDKSGRSFWEVSGEENVISIYWIKLLSPCDRFRRWGLSFQLSEDLGNSGAHRSSSPALEDELFPKGIVPFASELPQ